MRTEEMTWRSIAQIRWLQVKELKIKYPNNEQFGAEVRKLVNNTPNENN